MKICGIDEVGRGCLAGDVYACAVIFHSAPPEGIRDSKKLNPAMRTHLDTMIRATAHISIGKATVVEIDRINILQATMLAMQRALHGLDPSYLKTIDEIIVDGNRAPTFDCRANVRCVVGGDDSEITVGAASIVAKVARDSEMQRLHLLHPQYDWTRNKGYGSPLHLAGIEEHGPTAHHRMTFAPLKTR